MFLKSQIYISNMIMIYYGTMQEHDRSDFNNGNHICRVR